MHLKRIFALQLVLVFCSCCQATSNERGLARAARIIGGSQASEGQWPWLVNLRGKIVTRRLFGIFPTAHKYLFCGGSVVNSRWILTAAHCFDDNYYPTEARRPSTWEAKLASVELQEGFVDRIKHLAGVIFDNRDWRQWEIDLDRIVIHPNYSRNNGWENDIALVRLETAVPSGRDFSRIQQIKLPPTNDTSFPAVGDTCVMKGWGCTNGGGSISQSARSVNLPIFSASRCRSMFGSRALTKRICAGYLFNGRGICSGDSGGPLTCRNDIGEWVQVGVASFTSRDTPGSYPAVFTRVSAYLDWINRITRS